MNNFDTILHMQNRFKYIQTTKLISTKLNVTGQRLVNEIAILILIFIQKWGKNTNADVLSRFPENIKNVTRSTRMKYLSAVKD